MLSSKVAKFAIFLFLCALLYVLLAFLNRKSFRATVSSYEYLEASAERRSVVCPIVPQVRVKDLNCPLLFRGGDENLSYAQQAAKINESLASNFDGARWSKDYSKKEDYCKTLWYERCYINTPLTDEEASFPIAYSILIYKDVWQFERLLRAIYRPQNYYCVHIDKSSEPSVHEETKAIVTCFDNVFIASQSVDVVHGRFSVLEADLVCMKDLLAYKSWKYFINLTGQEFPLKTNLVLVRTLKALSGSNAIQGSPRFVVKKRLKKAPALKPNVTLSKGAVRILATRAYVDFAINNPVARAFLDWLKPTDNPDETFFTSLSYSPHLGVPGTTLPKKELRYIARYVMWKWGRNESSGAATCSGKYARGVCVLGVGDLTRLGQARELFANKFHADFQPVAYDCMEEWIFNQTRAELGEEVEVVKVTSYSASFEYKNSSGFQSRVK